MSDLAVAALREVARLRLATDEGSLRVRADRMWELAKAALAAGSLSGDHYGHPLSVTVENRALTIRIGAQTLAHAVSYADWANPWNEEKQDHIRTFAISQTLFPWTALRASNSQCSRSRSATASDTESAASGPSPKTR